MNGTEHARPPMSRDVVITMPEEIAAQRNIVGDVLRADLREGQVAMKVPESKRWLVHMGDEELSVWAAALEILTDDETMQVIRKADEELVNGQTLSFEQVFGHEQPACP
jgi:hypothetical protein